VSERLAGRVAIVTGAGSRGPGLGNGKATAILFAREGARVLCVDAVAERAAETVGLIRAEGAQAEAFVADVTRRDDCRAMVAAAVERWGRLDVLHNNVGIESRKDLLEVTEEEWDQVMAVDLRSMFLATQQAVPAMIERGGGAVICVSSIAGMRGHGRTAYATAKAGVIGFVRSIAVQLGPRGVRVNAIAPGTVGPRAPSPGRPARHRGDRLGRGVGRRLPGQRRGALGHRPGARHRRRPHGDHALSGARDGRRRADGAGRATRGGFAFHACRRAWSWHLEWTGRRAP
jgi:NAD(P)-dependent dehydrogenase (short-subunit alcohol dehydrogenase family)